MRVIGAGRHTPVLAGWRRIMTGSASLPATGRENTAGWTTITVGTTSMTAISAIMTASAKTIAEIGIESTTGIAAAKPRAALKTHAVVRTTRNRALPLIMRS